MAGDEALRSPEEQSESDVIGSSVFAEQQSYLLWQTLDDDIEVGKQSYPTCLVHRRRHRRNTPLERRDRANNTPNDFPIYCPHGSMSFKETVVSNAEKISLKSLCILLFICHAIMLHLVKELSLQFLLKSDSSDTTQAPLSLGNAFQKFYTEITYEMIIMLVFLLTLLLSCPRPLFVFINMLISLVGVFLYIIPDMMSKAPRTVVTCDFFTVPVVWFTTLAALVLSLIFVCLALFSAYLIHRCAGDARGSMEESEFDLEDCQLNV